MGISTFVLFDKNLCISADEMKNELQKLCLQKNIVLCSEYEEYDSFGKLRFSYLYFRHSPFGEDRQRTLMWYFYDKNYPDREITFDWDKCNKKYLKCIVSDDFYENENLLFRVSHVILKAYPYAKLWIEENWFYTLEDLEKIAENPYDNEWCYKNPISL